MARVLDLNTVQSSIMDVTLQDKDRTLVRLDFPTEELVRELEAMVPELNKLEKGDRTAINMAYELAAKLINCNLDYIKVTAQELRTTYRMSLLSAVTFFSAYLDAIHALENEKNYNSRTTPCPVVREATNTPPGHGGGG